ncbi:MAG: ATP-binding protein [Phycisphaeraceae bacterium]
MATATTSPAPDLETVEHLLSEFQHLETQLQQVREGLTHSHRLATLGTIAAIIAHEFNNILTPIMTYSQLALANPDDHQSLLKAAEKSALGAERAARICSSLLGFAREADEQHAAPLRRTVEDAIACMAREPAKDNIDLKVDLPDVQVALAPLSLQQVLLNLLLNAKKAMGPRGGKIRITGRVAGSLVYIDLADSGPGIPPAIRDRLFEPFVTQRIRHDLDDAPEKRGTGLGLCICRDIIHQAGGTIGVDSAPGQGAVFHIALPKADDLFEST